MAWVSNRVFAILSGSEEGKDIIEKLPDLSQEECQKELDDFFGSDNERYNQAKVDDEAEEKAYQEMGDEEISESETEEELEVSDDDISEALADYQWQITANTTAGQYAQECADRLGVSKERVFDIIRQQAPDQIQESSNMFKIIDAWEGNYEYKEEEK